MASASGKSSTFSAYAAACTVALTACGDGASAVGGDAGGAGDHAVAGSNAGSPEVDRDAAAVELPASEDGLKVVYLWTSPDLNEHEYTPARLVYDGREYPYAEAKVRGTTALMYPKLSFTLKLPEDEPFDAPEHGMHARRRIVLTTTFDDNSHVRQRLAFELWNRLEPTIRVRAFNAVLYLDGRYHGLYLVGDHVDEDLMAAHGLWPGGNLYKARTHEANLRPSDFRGEPKQALEAGYTKEEGTPEAGEIGAFADLHSLIAWLADTPEDELVATFDQVIDRGDFEAWLLLVSAIDASDSAGKNGYLYHDPRPRAPDPRWHYVPWDFNASFGQDWQTWRTSSQSSPSSFDRFNALFERMTSIAALEQPLRARYADALAGPWSRADVLALFDQYSAEVAVAARRDELAWAAAMRAYDWGEREDPFTDYEQERAYVRRWIEERWQLLEQRYR